jgi:hypothetical protein
VFFSLFSASHAVNKLAALRIVHVRQEAREYTELRKTDSLCRVRLSILGSKKRKNSYLAADVVPLGCRFFLFILATNTRLVSYITWNPNIRGIRH